MNRLRSILLGSLVAGILVVVLWLMWVQDLSAVDVVPIILVMLCISLAFSLGSLLGIWVALGGQPSAWRFLAVTVGGAACVWLAEEACFVLAQTVVTSLLFWVLRLVGVGLVKVSPDGCLHDPAAGGGRFQFSLRSLLEWTTALAVLLGLLHYLPDDFFSVFLRPETWFVSIPGALVATAAFWATLGTRGPTLRFAALGLVLTIPGSIAWLLPSLGGLWGACAVFAFLGQQALWDIELLRLFRTAGYRLSVRWKRPRNREEESCTNGVGY